MLSDRIGTTFLTADAAKIPVKSPHPNTQGLCIPDILSPRSVSVNCLAGCGPETSNPDAAGQVTTSVQAMFHPHFFLSRRNHSLQRQNVCCFVSSGSRFSYTFFFLPLRVSVSRSYSFSVSMKGDQ